jgi:hypothetical protein
VCTGDLRQDDLQDQERQMQAMVAQLARQSEGQRWWLGYLNTGADGMIFPGAPVATLYSGWEYVLVEAGPRQAATWRKRARAFWWQDLLPDLMFPADHSWLVSTLCDDDWTCIGGPPSLVGQFLAHPDLRAQPVRSRPT